MFLGPSGRESSRLSTIIDCEQPPFDVQVLAGAALAQPANDSSQTPYRRVVRRRVEVAPLADIRPPEPASDLEAVDWLRTLLQRAVDRALAGVKRVGVLAGGGLDSAAVLALATDWARRSGGSAFAVALDFASDGDDRPHMRALEAHLECEVLRVPPERAASRFSLLQGVDAAPFPWPTGPMEVELLAVARAHGAERCLSGAGGDELFDGNPRSLAAYLRRGKIGPAVRSARRIQGFYRPRSPLFDWLVRPLLAPLQPRVLRTWRDRYRPAHAPAWAGPAAHAFLRARSQIDKVSAHRDYVAWLRHQEIVASGCDLREPFFDADLIEAIAQLPGEWLLRGDARRGLFRDAMHGLLPESVRLRGDKARFEPAQAEFVEAAGGFERLRELSTLERLASLGIVAPSWTTDAFDAFARDPRAAEPWLELWPALAVEAFLRAPQRRAWRDLMKWLAEHLEDGELAYRIGRDGSDLVAEWLGVVRLVARRDASVFRFEPEPGAVARDVDKIRQGSGQLLLRQLQGKLGLHGAAVEVDGRAVVLLAESSGGKSTLAASLCAQPGARFLADDAVALDIAPNGAACVVSLESQHWLESDARDALGHDGSAAGKEPVSARDVGAQAPLVAFFELRFADVPEPRATDLRGIEALAGLMPQVVRFVIDEPDVQRRELDAVLQLLNRVRYVRIERPRRLELLRATTDLVAGLARGIPLPTAFSGASR